MPQGAQSILPLTSTDFTAVDGTTYKASIDRFTAVGSQICGPFYVYPSSPASMTVLIDAAFTYWPIGLTVVINGAQSSIVLTAPVSNSRWATVYWDFTSNAPGVIYGVSSPTPFPILPDTLGQLPIAIVLLTSISTSVVAANIEDIRGFNSFAGPISKTSGTFTTPNQSLTTNVNGASSISLYCSRTTTASTGVNGLALTNYRIGTPLFVRFDNQVGTSIVFFLQCVTPSGTQLVVQVLGYGGGHTIVQIGGTSATGITIPASTAITLTGNSFGSLVDLSGN